MGYFLELVLYMAPFMKTALELRLKGVTNDRDDPSVSLFFSNDYSLALWIYLG
jgi:RNA 3'-terminal phosphate cyclase